MLTVDSQLSTEINFLCFLKVSNHQWGSKVYYGLCGESPQKRALPKAKGWWHVLHCPAFRMIWQRHLCKEVGDHPVLGTVSETKVSQNTSAVGLWCEGTTEKQNNWNSHDKLSLSSQSVAILLLTLNSVPCLLQRRGHTPASSWLEACDSLNYFSSHIAS